MRWQRLIIILCLWSTAALGVPCQLPSARFDSIRFGVFDDPLKALAEARQVLQNPVDLHQRMVCGLQLVLASYLADASVQPWKVAMEEAILQGREAYPVESALMESLLLNMAADHPADLLERIKRLDAAVKPMPLPVRAFFLYLLTELITDPVYKAGLETEVETLIANPASTPDFERVLLLEYQAYHIDRNRNPGRKIELRESFLPRLRKLKLGYWQAFIIYNLARTYEYLGTDKAYEAAARYYAEAEAPFQRLEKDTLYASILLGKSGVWHRQGRRAEAIRLVKQAETYFIAGQSRVWQGEVWKRLAVFYLDDKRYKEAQEACDKATALFSEDNETDRNQIDEIRARVEYGLGNYDKAVELLQKYSEDFQRIEVKQRQQYVQEQGARYGLTLEEERNTIRQLNQETAKKQALIDAEGRKARERGLLVRLFATLLSLVGAVWLVWILRRGLVLGQTIRNLNSHMENHVLERFLPPTLVREVAAGRLHLDERPNTRLVTILAADIVSFTNGTESLGSERIAVILNRFMVTMADVIFEHKGTIDKFIGDGVIAIFGAPVDMDAETQALQASRCAQAMIKALDGLNQELLAGHSWKLRLRIGMHQGVALVGSFGTRQRSDYGAIGDAVHIAARIQGVAGPNEILLTTSVKHHLDSTLCSRRGDLKIREQSAGHLHALAFSDG
ncbi:MAG: adenylate/guanylate cyclase domain-containing protein [Minicystis sp.]